MKARLQSLPITFTRGYAIRTRRKTSSRPPSRVPDPLDKPDIPSRTFDDQLTFIHRPPPSVPSPYSYTTAPSSPLLRPRKPSTIQSSSEDVPLPPFLRPSAYKPDLPSVSGETVEKIRELRREDPEKYTRTVLAKQFAVTPNFVSKVAALKKSQRKTVRSEVEKEHEKIRERWGERKTIVRAIRQKRRDFW